MILNGQLTAIRYNLYHYMVKATKDIDWRLLVFLVLILNVKLVFKLAAVFFILLVHPIIKNTKLVKPGPVQFFYISMIFLALLNAALHGGIADANYLPVLLTGIFFWLLCLFISGHLRSFADTTSGKVEQTLVALIIINALVSFLQLYFIMADSGSLNPFSYQGEYQKYFISTGDYIKGLSFDTSTTNAAINAMGLVFFLYRKRYGLVFLCMSVLLITSSNFINLVLLLSLLVYLVNRSSLDQKSAITICVLMMVVFMSKVSPENSRYSAELYAKFFDAKPVGTIAANTKVTGSQDETLLSAEQVKERIAINYLDSLYRSLDKETKTEKKLEQAGRPLLPADDIHSAAFQHKDSVHAKRFGLMAFIADHKNSLPYAGGSSVPAKGGKLQALKNDLAFFKDNPGYVLTGTGMGNYSSKLAFRVSGLNMSGGFPGAFIYISPFFISNHLDIYLYFFTQKAARHSVANAPNSVYNQLGLEYGLVGLILFVLLYLRYFFSAHGKRFPLVPMLILFGGLLSIEYWFEQLSLIIFFELMMYSHRRAVANHA